MIPLRLPPGTAELKDTRALEYFLAALHAMMSPIGTVTIDLPSIAAGGIATFTIPVQGARPGQQQSVSLAPPDTVPAGLLWCGYVSGQDTVTVRVYNTTGSAIDPPAATWGASVRP
jgi:hypothetical protein